MMHGRARVGWDNEGMFRALLIATGLALLGGCVSTPNLTPVNDTSPTGVDDKGDAAAPSGEQLRDGRELPRLVHGRPGVRSSPERRSTDRHRMQRQGRLQRHVLLRRCVHCAMFDVGLRRKGRQVLRNDVHRQRRARPVHVVSKGAHSFAARSRATDRT